MTFPRFQCVLTAILFVAPALRGQTAFVFAGAKPTLTRGGGQAVSTPLGKISAIAVDHSGTVYFADASQALIMKVTPDGILTVIGGNGSTQITDPPEGDGGPAIDAPIPWAGLPMVLDGSGNLFIADGSNIREIATDGIIHTVMRGSQYQLNDIVSGLAIDGQGRILFADLGSHCVWRLNPDGTLTKVAGNGTYSSPIADGRPATDTGLGQACGLAVDSAGNVYIADFSDNLVLKVEADDGTIHTLAGEPDNTGNAPLWDVDSLAFDSQGNLFAFYGLASVAMISQDGMISPIPLGQWGYSGDGGPASAAQFAGSDAFTNQFALDDAGNIFVPDGGNGRLRKIDTSGVVTTIAGNGDYQFAGDGGSAKDALLSAPNYVSFGPDGELYVSDNGNHRVRRITPDGVIQTVAGNGETYPGNSPPTGVPALSSPVGTYLYAATGAADGGFYFSESWFIRKVDSSGTVFTVAGTLDGYGVPPDGSSAMDLLLSDVEGLALGPDRCLYFTDESVIFKLNLDGSFLTVAGDPTLSGDFSGDGGPALGAKLGSARGLAFDFWTPTQKRMTGGSRRETSLQVDSRPPWRIPPANESHWNQAPFYFADGFYGRVRKVDSNGIISTIAGNGGVGYAGDGGPALQATMFYPQAVTVDRGGYVYVSDWGNGVVRRIAPNGIITTLVGGLLYPAGLAVDAKGTLYVADPGNNRVVAVTNPQQ